MISVRIYRALSDLVVEVSAVMTTDYMGNPQPPQGVFLGRAYGDCTGSLNTPDLSEALYRVLDEAENFVGSELGGWHALV